MEGYVFRSPSAAQTIVVWNPYLREDIKALIPTADLVYWDYYSDDAKVYGSMLKAGLSIGRNVLFADGCFRWICFAPRVSASIRYARAGS